MRVGEALAEYPILHNIGPFLAPTQEAANYLAKMQYEAAAIEPPYGPYPAPQLAKRPWGPRKAEIRGAVEADAPREKKCGVRRHHPSAARPVPASPRATVAGEIAGA